MIRVLNVLLRIVKSQVIKLVVNILFLGFGLLTIGFTLYTFIGGNIKPENVIQLISSGFKNISDIIILLIIAGFCFIVIIVTVMNILALYRHYSMVKSARKKYLVQNIEPKINTDTGIISPNPSFSISHIEITNFKGIIDCVVDFPLNSAWIFLTGENGYGKTIFLQAITLALYNKDMYANQAIKEHVKSHIQVNIECLSEKKNTLSYSIRKKSSEQFRSLVAFGTNRIVYDKKPEISPYGRLLNKNLNLGDIEDALITWYDKKDKETKLKYKNTISALEKLLNIDHIEVELDFGEYKIFYYSLDSLDHSLPRVTSNELAAGFRAILGIVGDICLHFYKTSDEDSVIPLSEFKGIVIIDELELHLHPKWQKELPSIFSSVFPKIQFIASTHSPIPLLGAPDGSIFMKVNRSAEKGITVERWDDRIPIKKLLPNAILNSPMFDLDDLIPTDQNLEDIRTEDNFEEAFFNHLLQQKIDELKNEKE